MNILSIRKNPILLHTLYTKRSNWRFGASIGLTALTYSPIGITVFSMVIGLIGMLMLGLLLPLVMFVTNPQKTTAEARLFIDETRQEIAALTQEDVYDFVTDVYDDLYTFSDEVLPWFARRLFYTTVSFALVLLGLFAPTMSASLIAGERQRQTLDILLISLLPAHRVVLGKLLSALVYVLAPVGAVWTLLLLCFSVRGVSLIEVIVAILMLFVTGVAFTTIGLFVSSIARGITSAMMITYGLVLPLLFIVPPLLMVPVSFSMDVMGFDQWGGTINFYGWGLVVSLNPIGAGLVSAIFYDNYNEDILWEVLGYERSIGGYFIMPWLIYLVIYSGLSIVMFGLTSLRLKSMSNG
ncbi:ABC transporter permease subunit [Anaerolineales bacterium HSG24]|nr:ABC transporter permease subunit [Anaerolineales bacterium HSG24]